MDTKNRRARLTDLAKQVHEQDSAFLFFSGREGALAKFRPESNFLYLTGFQEPEAFVVFRPSHAKAYTLFLRPRDPAVELWDGPRLGPQAAPNVLGCDQSFSFADLEEKLPELLSPCRSVHFKSGADVEIDRIVHQSLASAQNANRRSGRGRLTVHDPVNLLGELRVLKSAEEIALMKKAAAASIEGHRRAMAFAHPGCNEVQVYGQLVSGFYDKKATGEGYSAIVGSGVNATVLHYRNNNRDMQNGELLLIDAGAEVDGYTADITRTFPVNGKFSPAQKDLYQSVLETQIALISEAKVGETSVSELQNSCAQKLSGAIHDLKLIPKSKDEIFETQLYKKYYPHGVGHFLGLEVHDVGLYQKGGSPRRLEAGMVITIEPGLYIPETDGDVPPEFRGLGVRIEDDVHITSSGPEVLTQSLAKSVDEIEAATRVELASLL